MRKIVYSVAMSLDGYLAGPNGEADRIVMDPEIDFTGMMARFDTVLMGRRTSPPAAPGSALHARQNTSLPFDLVLIVLANGRQAGASTRSPARQPDRSGQGVETATTRPASHGCLIAVPS